jgi:hypothetical protein
MPIGEQTRKQSKPGLPSRDGAAKPHPQGKPRWTRGQKQAAKAKRAVAAS